MGTGKELASLERNKGIFSSVSLTDDGSTLAAVSYEKEAERAKSGGITTQYVGRVKLWDLATRKQRTLSEKPIDGVVLVAITRDGKILASGSMDGTVKIWDVAAGKELHSYKGHTGPIESIVFTPDGKTLASGSGEYTEKDRDALGFPMVVCGESKLWNVATGKEEACFKGHTHAVTSIALTADGHTLVSGSPDKTIKLWDVTTGKERGKLAIADENEDWHAR